MRFLIIMEDGTIFKSITYDEDEINALKDGLLDIVDTSEMKYLDYNEKTSELSWEDLNEWK